MRLIAHDIVMLAMYIAMLLWPDYILSVTLSWRYRRWKIILDRVVYARLQ